MSFGPISYFLFGLALVLLLAGIWIYTFAKKRQAKVEEPKFRMLDDDE